jgi:flagellar assembly protein FliH
LERLGEEHTVVVQVNEALLPMIEERMSSVSTRAGFSGRVTVAAAADISMGDCRIQWSKGGASRDCEAFWREIDGILARNIGAPGADFGKSPESVAGLPTEPKTRPEADDEPAIGIKPEDARPGDTDSDTSHGEAVDTAVPRRDDDDS